MEKDLAPSTETSCRTCLDTARVTDFKAWIDDIELKETDWPDVVQKLNIEDLNPTLNLLHWFAESTIELLSFGVSPYRQGQLDRFTKAMVPIDIHIAFLSAYDEPFNASMRGNALPSRMIKFVMNVHGRWETAGEDDAVIGWCRGTTGWSS